MREDLQRRIQRYGWDKAAGYYEISWQQQLKPAQHKMLRLTSLKPGEQVLDVACGTGLVTFPAALAVGSGGIVVGCDISDGMIVMAKQIAKQKGIDNVVFQQMDAEKLNLDDELFDVTLCALGIMYVPDPVKAMLEMYRVLRPGGRSVVLVWGERRNCGWADIFQIVDAKVKSDVCPLFFQQGTKEVLKKTFLTAGFADIQQERFSYTLNFKTPEEACMAAFSGGPVALAYNKFDNRTKDEVHAEYLASIENYQEGESYKIPGEFVVVKGFKK